MFIKALDGTMTAFDVSGHMQLAHLPVVELAFSLTVVSLVGGRDLWHTKVTG